MYKIAQRLVTRRSLVSSSRSPNLSFKTKPIQLRDLNVLYDDVESNQLLSTDSNLELSSIDNANQCPYQIQLSNTLRPFHSTQDPVLIRNFTPNFNLDHKKHPYQESDNDNHNRCNAITKWKDLDYLESLIGYDTKCFVEMGKSYNSSMGRPEIPFGDYLSYMRLFHEQFGSIEPDNDDIVRAEDMVIIYMAQNEISTLIPYHEQQQEQNSIKDDFIIPQLCHDSKHNVGHGQMYNSMFWFGPRTCVSPLHYDPLDNLLMQFVGRKRVYLFPNDDNSNDDHNDQNNDGVQNTWHYAGQYGQQYNTSPIDILKDGSELVETYPMFEHAPNAFECVIYPGDLLYIPKRWWHHVTSLDTAISINVWWR